MTIVQDILILDPWEFRRKKKKKKKKKMDLSPLIEQLTETKSNVEIILRNHDTGERILGKNVLLHFRRMQSFLREDIKMLETCDILLLPDLTKLRSVVESEIAVSRKKRINRQHLTFPNNSQPSI